MKIKREAIEHPSYLIPKFNIPKSECHYRWFSFSFEGKNTGCITVEASSDIEAIEKVEKLIDELPHDSILLLFIPNPASPLEVLQTAKQLLHEGGYSEIGKL